MCKIENNQFGTADDIDFSQIINNKILQFEEAIAMKNISVHSSLAKVNVMIHPMLADIIVSNLVSNAIRYTPEKGNIILELNNSFFKICNEGAPLKAKNQELFSRFYKEHEDSTSTGLGLALVKQIALINNHDINYAYINSSHIFTYFFKN